nr:carboxypeptidase-like regulatory domain-containing protein [Actinomycetospora sp. NBRC 106378]
MHGQDDADRVEPAEGDPAGPALPAPTVSHAAAPTSDDRNASLPASNDRNGAPSGAVLTGRVTTAEGRPVGATLTATDASGHQIGRARTDSEGTFTLRARPGTALLICSAPGHAPRAETLTIGVGGTRHDVVLEQSARGARTPVAGS